MIRKNRDLLVSRREAALPGVTMDKCTLLADSCSVEPLHVALEPTIPNQRISTFASVRTAAAAGSGSACRPGMLLPAFDRAQALLAFLHRAVLGTYRDLATLGTRKRDLLRFGDAQPVARAFAALRAGPAVSSVLDRCPRMTLGARHGEYYSAG